MICTRDFGSTGETVSFPISTVHSGTLGTDQIQTAPLMVRYPDSAYLAHGNYGVLYDLTVPIYNPTESELLVGLRLQSPLKARAKQLICGFSRTRRIQRCFAVT